MGVKPDEALPQRCPYCKGMFNTFKAWHVDHYPNCKAQWVKRRAMERSKADRSANTQPIEDPFKGLDRGE